MAKVIRFRDAAEKIISRRLLCLRTLTSAYYRTIGQNGTSPIDYDRVKDANLQIEKLERSLLGIRSC
jgi:hypothetical protein